MELKVSMVQEKWEFLGHFFDKLHGKHRIFTGKNI